MALKWNSQRGGRVQAKKPSVGGPGVWIFLERHNGLRTVPLEKRYP